MVFGTVAIVDRIVVVVVVVGDGGSTTSVGNKGVVGEGVSVSNSEEVVEEVFVITMCRWLRLCVTRELKMLSGVRHNRGMENAWQGYGCIFKMSLLTT